MTNVDALPDDPPFLKRLLIDREETIAQLRAEIACLKRRQYGRSAERVAEALPPDDVPTSADPVPATDTTHPLPSHEASPRAGRALPAHLPRETIEHVPSACRCPECGGVLRKLGEDVSEMLDFVPGYFKVIRHVRPKLSCRRCACVLQEPAPPRPIERGLPAPGLLAQVLVAKYADHAPLYRQQGIYRRAGIELERATLADWVGRAAALLSPLAQAIGRYVLAADKIHADDTPVPVLEPGRGRTKTGRLWAYVRDDRPAGSQDSPAVWYRYSPDRKGEHPFRHLARFSGLLQADAYAGFNALYRRGDVVEAACWAHARRKFYDLYERDGLPLAAEAIRRIGLLYAIEREIRGQLPLVRQAQRQARAGGVLEELRGWLTTTLTTVSAKSALAGAIQYALTRWEALTRYRDDGRIELDNNTAERAIRPLVLGRRNYLFAGSDAGGETAAAIYSLIGTCRLNGIEPFDYLRSVLERIAEHPCHRIEELLPWRLSTGPTLRLCA